MTTGESWDNREKRLIIAEQHDGAMPNVKLVEVDVFDARDAPRGFLSLLPETRSAISRRGGRNAHKMGVAYEWNSDEARAAGLKGGASTAAKLKESR